MAPKKKAIVRLSPGTMVRTRRMVIEESFEVPMVRENEKGEAKLVPMETTPKGEGKVTEIAIEGDGDDTQEIYQSSVEEFEEEEPEKAEEVKEKRVAPVTAEEETQPLEEEEEEREIVASEARVGKKGGAAPKEKEEEGRRHGRKMGKKRKRGVEKGVGGGVEGREGYKRYVMKVLKQVHPEMGASSMAMKVLDGYMKDMFERIVGEATTLAKVGGKVTLSSRDIQDAVRLVLPGDLAKHAVAEGVKAVTKFCEHPARTVS